MCDERNLAMEQVQNISNIYKKLWNIPHFRIKDYKTFHTFTLNIIFPTFSFLLLVFSNFLNFFQGSSILFFKQLKKLNKILYPTKGIPILGI